MPYRRRYRGGRRSNSRYGSVVGDSAAIAHKFGPRGAVITGVVGFVTLYVVLPWMLVAWADYNKAKMAGRANAELMSQLLDTIFTRRFIHPPEWAGIAILVVCIGIAVWKLLCGESLGRKGERDASFLAKHTHARHGPVT